MSNEENTKQEEIVQQEEMLSKPLILQKTRQAIWFFILKFKRNKSKSIFWQHWRIVILLVLLMTMGGNNSSKPTISGPVLKDLAVGQRYVLKSANAYDPQQQFV